MGGSQSVEVPGGGSEGYHVLKVSGRESLGPSIEWRTGRLNYFGK